VWEKKNHPKKKGRGREILSSQGKGKKKQLISERNGTKSSLEKRENNARSKRGLDRKELEKRGNLLKAFPKQGGRSRNGKKGGSAANQKTVSVVS